MILGGHPRKRDLDSRSDPTIFQMESIGGKVLLPYIAFICVSCLVNTTIVIKIKKEIIQKAKIKKSYAKLKAREPIAPAPFNFETEAEVEGEAPTEAATQELHPDRQRMLDNPEDNAGSASAINSARSRRPAYFEKDQAYAEAKKAEADSRRQEFERREKDRKEKNEERERFRRAMAKARTGGKNGQRKLGRESKILLEKVKRMTGS